MLKRTLVAAALLSSSAAFATTTIGGATLLDNATVINGTVTPTGYLTYVSGGNGQTGTADGTNFVITGETPAAAMATADHHWLQYDPFILVFSATARSSVIAIPAIDHGWTSDNNGAEFYEPFEYIISGCDSTGNNCEEGRITRVWTRGVDDSGAMKNADDWTAEWSFRSSYQYFKIASGDRLVGGPFSPGEGEIDALAFVPEPAPLALLLGGALALLGLRRRNA